MANGSRHSLRIVPEVTYGVTPATPAFKTVRHTGTTLALSKEALQSEELRDDRQIADFRHGAFQVGGDISFEFSYGGAFDDLLEAALGGTWAVNVLKAGTTRRSFTVERFFGDILTADKPYHRFRGCEVNTLSLAISANAMVTGTFGIMGRELALDTVAIAGATTAAATTVSPFDSFTGTITEGGMAIGVVTEISLEITNTLEAKFVVGDKKTARPSIGRSNVSGTMTVYFENSTLLEKFINETESSVQFELVDLAGNKYTFLLPRVKYNGGQPDVSGEGPITLAMPFQALLASAAPNTNIQITRTPA